MNINDEISDWRTHSRWNGLGRLNDSSARRESRAGASESKLIGLLLSLPRVAPSSGCAAAQAIRALPPCLVLPHAAPSGANQDSGKSRGEAFRRNDHEVAALPCGSKVPFNGSGEPEFKITGELPLSLPRAAPFGLLRMLHHASRHSMFWPDPRFS